MANILIAYSPVNGRQICDNLVDKLEVSCNTVSFVDWPSDPNPSIGWPEYVECIRRQTQPGDILIGICFGGTLAIDPSLHDVHHKLKGLILVNTPVDFSKVPTFYPLQWIHPMCVMGNISPEDLHRSFTWDRSIYAEEPDLSNPITRWAETSFNMLHKGLIQDLIIEVQMNTFKDRISPLVRGLAKNIVGQKDKIVPPESSELIFNHIFYGVGGHLTPFLKPDKIVEIIKEIEYD